MLKQRLSVSKIQASETEVDDFLRTIKAVPSDKEVEQFLRTIKAVPTNAEIDEFLLSIKAQDIDGRPMLYKDGQPMDFVPQGSSPFANETMAQLKKAGSMGSGLEKI